MKRASAHARLIFRTRCPTAESSSWAITGRSRWIRGTRTSGALLRSRSRGSSFSESGRSPESERPGRRGGRLDRPQSGQSSGRQNFARSAGPGVIGEHSSVSGISHVSQGLKAIREHDHRQWDFARFIDFEVRYSLTTCLRRRHCRDRNIPYPGRRHCQDRTGAWTYPDISGERIDCISRFMRAESDRIGISAGGLDSI